MSLTIGNALLEGINLLKKHDKQDATLDATYLLMHVLKLDKVKLLLSKNHIIDKETYEEYSKLLVGRAKGVPLQYLLKKQEFMGLEFNITKDTLIPRRETEELVELAIELIDNSNKKLIMDIGTGTGCIPISLAVFIKDIFCLGIDCSLEALNVARKNSELHRVEDKISWILSNLFVNIEDDYKNKIDMIISNPPYIKTGVISMLMPEVKEHEPILALDGGEDGLDFYREICEKGKDYLKDDGYILFEIGHDQKEDVIKILMDNKFRDIQYRKDLSGMDRIVYGRK